MSENNNNIFYQLREQDTNTTGLQNGDFVCKLQRPMVLKEGDQLQINKAIIDSREEDGDNIILQNNTRFDFRFSYYLTNYITHPGRKNANGGAVWTTAQLDQEPYVLCESNTGTVFTCNKITIPHTNFTNIPINDVFVNYTDVNNVERKVKLFFSRDEKSEESPWIAEPGTIPINPSLNNPSPLFTSSNNVFTLTFPTFQGIPSQDLMGLTNQDILNADFETTSSSGETYEPVIIEKSVELEAGIYDYDDFCDRINSGMTEINSSAFLTAGDLTKNALLTTTGSEFYDSSGATQGAFQRGAIFVRADNASRAFIQEPASISGISGEFWLGTSQFVLKYDEIVDSFYFQYLNFPFYGGTQSGLKYQEYEAGVHTPARYRIVNKYGGIIFDSIESIDLTTNQSLNIFANKLKFNLSGLIPRMTRNTNSTATGSSASFPTYNLKDKENMTGANTSVDSAVIKSATFYNPPDPSDVSGALSNVITDQQNEIYAAGAVGKKTLEYGYFVIELRGLEGDLITENDIKKNVFGIVSRYYTSNNYTVGSVEDAIIYTHTGPTQYLNDLRIRILDSNYELANGIGTDNTIFLQHIKATTPIQEEAQQEKK